MIRRSRALCLIVCVAASVAIALPARGETSSVQDVHITSDDQFDTAHGVSSGTGTQTDPYVISGLQLQSVHIENTSKYVTIRNNSIADLILDWMGDRVVVTENTVGNLQVNRNVPRTGPPASGQIVDNTFAIVGQLRHWDGLFSGNTVGSPERMSVRSVNLDGFNGARFTDNLIYGFMDARLHGHHHSSGFEEPSHHHDGEHSEHIDHTNRYHRVAITHNEIHANAPYALAYLDDGHAGNDRTATSETEESLNDPHIHYTRMVMDSNTLVGAGIRLHVFNSDDERHTGTTRGTADITNNQIALGRDDFLSGRANLHGIQVDSARDVTLSIDGNAITAPNTKSGLLGLLEVFDDHAGILLHDFHNADITVAQNSVTNRVYGVRAFNFDSSVFWSISQLTTSGVDEDVSYENVPNEPT